MKSRQGEPFLAVVTLAPLPGESISAECLSMGPQSDAPDPEIPFLGEANLKLDAERSAVEISTNDPVAMPALSLILQVQCAGAPRYARHFSALIPPAVAKAQEQGAAIEPAKRHGFHLSLLPGDTVESIAAVLFPGRRATQEALVQQVIAGNPESFPDGRPSAVPAGSVLWFPDLSEVRKSALEKSPSSAKPGAAQRHGDSATPPSPGPAPEVVDEARAKPRQPVTLQRALELGDKPGPQECKKLMRLCGGEPPVIPQPQMQDDKAHALESGVRELRLKQEGIEQQLQRLELSLQTLQKTVNSAPAPTQAIVQPAPQAPKVEIRTVVKSEPVSWTIWLGLGALIIAAAAGGVAYGRRGSFSRGLAQTDEQLDRMLATAATVMRELESTPKPGRAPRIEVPLPPPTPRLPPALPALPEQPAAASPPAAAPVPDFKLGTLSMPPTADVDLKLASEPQPAASENAGLSNAVLFEMDQALDNTRSMFTDVDRFIALGRTQNALSLLQFQVHKDPRDRDSWIKLMAIYRQEKMDTDLAKAAREFRNNFPDENPPAV